MLNEFGGDWTNEKLDCLKDYLKAYLTILRKDHFYRIYYVDAFAGSGYISPIRSQELNTPNLFELETSEVENYLEGSTQIALSIFPGFDNFIFIEKNSKRTKSLELLKKEYPNQAARIQIENTDANTYLSNWCSRKELWATNRAVVFLDPFGMQVSWDLLVSIANTKAIDLWILFPIFGVNRLLTKNSPPPKKFAECLNRTFGTEEWISEFYSTKPILTLFGAEEINCKDTTFEKIGAFFIKRLEKIFPYTLKEPLLLCNSKNTPLYLLCFAASNPKGGPVVPQKKMLL